MEVLQRTANRGSISDGGYEIDNSLVLEDANDESMIRNYSGDGDRRTWTYSTWVKKLKFGSAEYDYMYLISAAYTSILFLNNDLLRVALYNGSSTVYADPAQVFRDGSAWYHIVVTLDSTDGTAADRVKIYINGVRVTEFDNSTYANMSQNEEFGLGQASSNYQFGYFFAGGAANRGFSGYVAETHYVNGTALDCTSFGEFDDASGIWKPKEYTGSHGTKGFYFKFDDASNLGKDSATSGIGDFSENNISAADQSTDTPTNNFATFNTLYDYDDVVINEGATKTTNENTANFRSVVSNIAVQNGKWYAEFTAGSNTGFVGVGLVEEMTGSLPKTQYLGQLGESISYYAYQGQILHGGSAQSTTGTFAGYGAGDVIGIALDKTNGFVYWHKNGTYQNSGDPTSGATGTGGIALSLGYSGYAQSDYYFMGYAQSSAAAAYANFGGYTADTPSSAASDANGYGTFEYAPPSGYYALCSKNLAEYG